MQDSSLPTLPVTRGQLLEQGDGRVVIGIPGSDYQLHLASDGAVQSNKHGEVRGVVRAKAGKLERVGSGGIFIEPVYGQPRRVQGRVVRKDSAANTLTVQGPCVVVAELEATQRATDIPIGELVAFNVHSGSRWVCDLEG